MILPLFQGVWCGLSCVRYNMTVLHIDDGNLIIIKYVLISRVVVNVRVDEIYNVRKMRLMSLYD